MFITKKKKYFGNYFGCRLHFEPTQSGVENIMLFTLYVYRNTFEISLHYDFLKNYRDTKEKYHAVLNYYRTSSCFVKRRTSVFVP